VSEDDVTKFFTLINSDDTDQLASAVQMTAPGSVARAYTKYLLESGTAQAQSGDSPEAQAVTHDGDVWKSCDRDNKYCATYGDVQAVGGKIATLTVNGKDLKPLIFVGGGRRVPLGSLGTVKLLTAYQSAVSGNLFVTVEVSAGAQPIDPDDDTAYRNPNGVQTNAAGVTGPTTLRAHSRANYLLMFTRAKIGGTVTFGAFTDEGNAADATATFETR
jgi:hypothetical protein